jgi:hypothetical protein
MSDRFQKFLADGDTPLIVQDVKANLMWDARETKAMTFEKAEAHVAKLNSEAFGGFTDWRLPTYHELTGLVDISRYSPAIDTAHFPACKSEWYWTGTPAAISPAVYAWLVNFYSGSAYWLHRDHHASVRAVRPSQ